MKIVQRFKANRTAVYPVVVKTGVFPLHVQKSVARWWYLLTDMDDQQRAGGGVSIRGG